MRQLKAAIGEDPFVQLPVLLAQALHHVQDVRPGDALGVDGNARFSETADLHVGLLEAAFHFRHVTHVDGIAGVDREYLILDVLDRGELSTGPNHPAAFALPEIAGRSVLVLAAEHSPDVGDCEPVVCQAVRIDDHLHFRFLAADDIRVRDAVDSLEFGFDKVFREPPVLGNINVRRQQRRQVGMLLGQTP